MPRAPVSLARALSKLGRYSRREAEAVVRAGRVRVDGVVRREPSFRLDLARAAIRVDDAPVERATPVYLALNKPRGLVTTRDDPRGRPTVYDCFGDASLPLVGPVGRLDRASEGLLLFTNDTQWGARLTDPATHVDKVYHVQIDRVPDAALLAALESGVDDDGERLAVKRAHALRAGARTGWLELVLDEGRNRHLRRLLGALGVEVRRLVRTAIGPLALGPLAKGAWRHLTPAEVRAVRDAAVRPPAHDVSAAE